MEPQAEAEVQESTNDKIVRESDKRPKAAQDHPKKARTLPKTGCYAVPPISQPGSPLKKKTNHPITLYPRKVSKPGLSGFLNQKDNDDDESEEEESTNENPDIKFKISNRESELDGVSSDMLM